MQISYGASSPSLSTVEMFPNFFRTIPSEVQSNSARFALMNKYGWEKVATLHETQTIFSQVHVYGTLHCTLCVLCFTAVGHYLCSFVLCFVVLSLIVCHVNFSATGQ